jgi:ketosteroid isomerase-like protein
MKFTAIALLTILSLVPACAPQPESEKAATPPAAAPAPSPVEVEAEITRLENEWVAAIVKKDIDMVNEILADDFNGTGANGATFPKATALEELKTGAYAVESMQMDEVSVNVYGDTAVSFTSQQEKSKYGGKDSSGHYHFTNVWVKRNGKWQVVASHGSPYGK